MTKTLTKNCGRCNGTGLYGSVGVCFGCMGNGAYVADRFLRSVGSSGLFFGVTGEAANGRQYKGIARAASAEAMAANTMAGYTFAPISEQQARDFFKRYGTDTQVSA